ncbi:glycogen debranching protein GlgX [Herbiconiux sp. SYSU D00978]|uniref:glycogen debranching protein GlgX n=1 Tax=Herbiconiux sp. SYSU D00978 TaxID=2812562 RepID=UPI001A95A65E|nr:glycogen debranching protein GlgX [Herbiconiux sp. SYSU D00978]
MPAADPFRNLGVRLTSRGGEIRVFSENATAIELCLFDDRDPDWIVGTIDLKPGPGGVWSGSSRLLTAGRRYALRADGPTGPTHAFNLSRNLLDPYARGLARTAQGGWHSSVVDDEFDWGGVGKPNIPLDHTVVYEAHVRGLTKLSPHLPEELRGTYAGLAHPSTIGYLKDLGITAVELLPVHQFVSEQRLVKQGRVNYWGYNTLHYFAPHTAYATPAAQRGGPAAVLREFKGMVRLLHEAGLEVILDVVYNHTSEEGLAGPTTSFRGLDNATYYRHQPDGTYIDVTGCGNTVDFSKPVTQRLVLDSLKYWANEVQVDGFRFDLAATLGRDENAHFDPRHPLLEAIVTDPELTGVKMIAEPWDVGLGGWQVGNFPRGWIEWNDGYRDRVREFWLTDVRDQRLHGRAPHGIGAFTGRVAGSAHVFDHERGPLSSINFVTAHDGFTLADLTSYDLKHNLGNGEDNRDGTNDNHSWNFGVEGPTKIDSITADRARAMRNLLGTLLTSTGIPMITAGDEFGRSQRGNNNAYCHDSELTWLPWAPEKRQLDLLQVTRTLLRLRRENPALRPVRYGREGEKVPSANDMSWFNGTGAPMTEEDWNSPEARLLQYLGAATPELEQHNRVLLVFNGVDADRTITLPKHDTVVSYVLLWDSADDRGAGRVHSPGDRVAIAGTSMLLFRADEP